jgi:hypothetical protein
MADEVYWTHKLKLNPGVTEAEFEKHAREELNWSSAWPEVSPCKKVRVLKAVDLPWRSNKSEEFDYLSISVWDKEEHRKFIEADGFSNPEVQAFMSKIKQSSMFELVGGLGSVEPIDL